MKYDKLNTMKVDFKHWDHIAFRIFYDAKIASSKQFSLTAKDIAETEYT
jgi:hypothetical protein